METNLEDKLSAILSDPNMMQQIQAMARSLGQSQTSAPAQQEQVPSVPSLPDISQLQSLGSLATGTSIDTNQKALLSALAPYLSHDRVTRLENAMRAAKVARLASSFLGNGGLQMLTGR